MAKTLALVGCLALAACAGEEKKTENGATAAQTAPTASPTCGSTT
jgi:hypothetical protein